jgi:hypothetical protein
MKTMKLQFELRSKTYPDKTWDNTIDFCIDHDEFIPHNYQKVILQIASDYGVYRKLTLLDDKKGMLLSGRFPTNELFSEWLSKRIDYFYKVKNSELKEDSDEVPYFPNSFQKASWKMSNFTPLVPYDVFWECVHKGIKLSKYECKLNLDTFISPVKKIYYELYT